MGFARAEAREEEPAGQADGQRARVSGGKLYSTTRQALPYDPAECCTDYQLYFNLAVKAFTIIFTYLVALYSYSTVAGRAAPTTDSTFEEAGGMAFGVGMASKPVPLAILGMASKPVPLAILGKPDPLAKLSKLLVERADVPLDKMQGLFAALDTNGDGVVDSAEWRVGCDAGLLLGVASAAARSKPAKTTSETTEVEPVA